MPDEKRVVWILGSGFSKSLGGPLLYDLLSYRGEAYLKTKFPKIDTTLYPLFWRHLKEHEYSKGQPIYWDHAEEFLDFLNTATLEGGPDRYHILRTLVYRDVPKDAPIPMEDLFEPLRQDAARCLAAECLFTTHCSIRSEAWRPYFKWARNVGHRDTIITFNYDMVLEKLGEHEPKLRFGAETVVSPVRSDTKEPAEAKTVNILKLHGSVGWFTLDRGILTAQTDTGAAAKLREDMIPFVVGPGPDKLLHQEGTLKPLWDHAVAALKKADVIVFLGYRFPPSDSQARSEILGAIRQNESGNLRIHTVLGPRTRDDDTVRLLKLLEHTLRSAGRIVLGEGYNTPPAPRFFEIITQPLYVEDFLTVLHDAELYGQRTAPLVLTAPEGRPIDDLSGQHPRIEVLDTDPDYTVLYSNGSSGHPDRIAVQARANDKAFTVWAALEIHNRSGKPARGITIDFTIHEAKLFIDPSRTHNVLIDEPEQIVGGRSVRQRIEHLPPGGSEKLVMFGVRPYDVGEEGDSLAIAAVDYVINGDAGLSVAGRFHVRLSVQGKVAFTLREALDNMNGD